jgi:hypothetical protein
MLNAGIDKQSFERRVQQVNSGALLKHAMTLADQYRQEGLEQGLEQGLELGETKAQRRMLLDVLEMRFGAVPDGLREHLDAMTNRDQLALLHKSAVCCTNLDAFVKNL